MRVLSSYTVQIFNKKLKNRILILLILYLTICNFLLKIKMMLRDNRNMFHAFDEFSLKVAAHCKNHAIKPVRLAGRSRGRLRTVGWDN